MDRELTRKIMEKVRQVEIKTAGLVDETLAGRYHSVFKGRGMNFDEVREYTPGDEVRTIDWNVTARTGHPFVKKYTEERELTVMLLIDVSASGDFGSGRVSKRELMAELGSLLAFSALRNSDRTGLILFTDTVELYIPPAKGKTHVLRIIREILFFQPKGRKTDISAALDFSNRVTKRKAVKFIISDYCIQKTDENSLETFAAKLTVSNRRHDIVAVSVSDMREKSLPDIGIIVMEDAETGDQVEIDTSRKKVRDGFKQIASEMQSRLKRTVRSTGADLLELSTDRDYLPALLGFFDNRKRRPGKWK